MHYAERNSRNLTMVATVLGAKGYKVFAYWSDYSDSAYSGTCTYWVEGRREETSKEFRVPTKAVAQPVDTDSEEIDRQTNFNAWLEEELRPIPEAGHAIAGAILKLVEKIRDLAPEAALPEGFINPIEALAEKLRTNILEGPKNESELARKANELDDLPL